MFETCCVKRPLWLHQQWPAPARPSRKVLWLCESWPQNISFAPRIQEKVKHDKKCKNASVAHGLCLVPLKSPHGFIWKVWIHCEFMRALTPSVNAQSLSSQTLKFEGFWRRAASVSLAPSPLEAQPAESSHGSTFKCLIPMSLHHVTPLVVDHGVYQGQDPSRLQCNLGSFTTKVHAAWEPNWSASSSLAWIWLVSSRLRLECKTPNLRSKGEL